MPARHRELLLEEAFYPVDARYGTPYPCQQSDLDVIRHHPGYNGAPWVSQRQATLEIVQHNHPRRRFPSFEREAILRLSRAINDAARYSWGPDLVIKSFLDLDTVFFGGALQGFVRISWAHSDKFLSDEQGTTSDGSPPGHALIRLNAEAILLGSDPFKDMFSTVLHEMCVSTIHLKSTKTTESLCIRVDLNETACLRVCASQTS